MKTNKLVKEHINEKFEEESDSIQDMGIGIPEFREIYSSLKDVNTLITSQIDSSFNIEKALQSVDSIQKFIFVATKYFVKEKFNLDMTIRIYDQQMAHITEFGTVKIGTIVLTFKINGKNNDMWFTISEVKYNNRKYIQTSAKCKTFEKLEREIRKTIDKFGLKIKGLK